ncbi:hypothetical protein PR048_032844 [Dryococelus australis]|uniref:Uncharacterized protein n=1 Tax=Dryococelus australis TaxID=614101 RepID=A0ABQ9G6B3_9NEOP|nr:hypothetical protein PR048_032844 [Dryococelus australis]
MGKPRRSIVTRALLVIKPVHDQLIHGIFGLFWSPAKVPLPGYSSASCILSLTKSGRLHQRDDAPDSCVSLAGSHGALRRVVAAWSAERQCQTISSAVMPGCAIIFPDPRSNEPSSETGSSLILVPIKQSNVVLSVGVFLNYICRRLLLISDGDFEPPISAVQNELHLDLQSNSKHKWCYSVFCVDLRSDLGSSIEPRWCNRALLKAIEVLSSVGMKGQEETGEPRENPLTNGIVRHDSHMRKSGVTRPGIEPGSPCWPSSRGGSSNTRLFGETREINMADGVTSEVLPQRAAVESRWDDGATITGTYRRHAELVTRTISNEVSVVACIKLPSPPLAWWDFGKRLLNESPSETGCRSHTAERFGMKHVVREAQLKEIWAQTCPTRMQVSGLVARIASIVREHCQELLQVTASNLHASMLMAQEFLLLSLNIPCVLRVVDKDSSCHCAVDKCGRDWLVVRPLASHQGEPGWIPCGVAPRFSHVGIVSDDVAGGRIFSGTFHLSHRCILAFLTRELFVRVMKVQKRGSDKGGTNSLAWRLIAPTHKACSVSHCAVLCYIDLYRLFAVKLMPCCTTVVRNSIGYKIDTQNCCTVRFRAGLDIEMKFISNRRNWQFEISIRGQQPLSLTLELTNESEIQNYDISLVQHFNIGTKIEMDPGSELGSFDLGSGKMFVLPGISDGCLLHDFELYDNVILSAASLSPLFLLPASHSPPLLLAADFLLELFEGQASPCMAWLPVEYSTWRYSHDTTHYRQWRVVNCCKNVVRQVAPRDVCDGSPGQLVASARNTFTSHRLHNGRWFLMLAPRVYSCEQAPAYHATLNHTPLLYAVHGKDDGNLMKRKYQQGLKSAHFTVNRLYRVWVAVEQQRGAGMLAEVHAADFEESGLGSAPSGGGVEGLEQVQPTRVLFKVAVCPAWALRASSPTHLSYSRAGSACI